MNIKRIDELRGIACLLVIAFHAIGSEPLLRGTSLSYAVESLQFIRMPIFIAITGLIYGISRDYRPLTWRSWKTRVGRLFAPFSLATLVVCVIDAVAGAGFHPIYAIVFGAWHLWYILALANILLWIVVMERLLPLTTNGFWLLALMATFAAAFGVFSGIPEFAISRAVILLPFFLAGTAIGSTHQQKLSITTRAFFYGAGLIALVLHQLSMNGHGTHWEKGSIVASAMGLCGFVLLSNSCPKSILLSRIGIRSFPIFLWHLPVAAVSSYFVLHRFNVEPHAACLTKIILGICIPIFAADIAETRYPHLAALLGARRPKRRRTDDERTAELSASSSDHRATSTDRLAQPPIG